MRRFTLGIACLCCFNLYAQNIEVVGGVNQNNFYDSFGVENFSDHSSSSYSSGLGYTFGVGIEELKIGWLNLRFTLGLERYSGEIELSEESYVWSQSLEAEIEKTVFSFGFYPLNFKILDKIDVNLGSEVSWLINENVKGTTSVYGDLVQYENKDLNDFDDEFNSQTYFGFAGRLAYDIKLSEKFTLSPQYVYYLGLLEEFEGFLGNTSSFRQHFSIGIQKAL